MSKKTARPQKTKNPTNNSKGGCILLGGLYDERGII